MTEHPAVRPLLDWYATSARQLPWRGAGAWEVLVSEVMLQQTPVARVLPVFTEWLATWPAPRDLAADQPGEAVRRWGRLGYPRRALRLHAAAVRCVDLHDGQVPDSIEALRALPGVGEYTAAAVAAFAYGERVVVLDTNVRRVHARLLDGADVVRPGSVTAAERRRADGFLPAEPARAAAVAAATMELGALVCTARSPACEQCPVADSCAWLSSGKPEGATPSRPAQGYAGTDRQCRGRLLAVVREATGAVDGSQLDVAWHDPPQRERALQSLLADGLIEAVTTSHGQRFQLPVSAGERVH